MQPTVKIRRIGPDDLEDIRTLALDIWPKAYRHIIGPDRVDAMLAELYDIDALEAEIKAGHIFWIASVNGVDAAYASAVRDGDRLWLKKLYCRQEYRGLGLGRSLMKEAMKTFGPTKLISLNVNKDNAPAIAYYLKSGFEVEAEVPVKMGPFEFEDLVMRKDVKETV